VTSVACEYPIRDRHKKFDILGIFLVSITGIVVIARLYQKLRFERALRLDDYLIVVCFVSYLASYMHFKQCTRY
jgi:hypothetical protein